MNRKVLVLNQDFSPITICTVKRAFLLNYAEKAEMVASANGYMIHSVTRHFNMPAVIRLLRYVHIPYKGVALTRQNVFKRDDFMCQYCGATKSLTLDHVIPRSKGGRSAWNNLVAACMRCNTRKGDHSPEQVGMFLKKHPYKPSYLMFLRDFSGFFYEEWTPYLSR